MYDTKKAAEFFVVAWCKDWTVGKYVFVVMEWEDIETGRPFEDFLEDTRVVHEHFPWIPASPSAYTIGIRQYVGGSFPKLSAWLFARANDMERLKCAPQIERLRAPKARASKRLLASSDKNEMGRTLNKYKQANTSYRASRTAFKTHQRSAWNVCKG